MNGAAWGIFAACIVAAVLLAAWEFVALLESACQWLLERSAKADRDSSRPAPPREGARGVARAQSQDGDGSSPTDSLSSSSLPAVDFGRRNCHAAALPGVAVAVQPDFDAFFGGLEAAVIAGGSLFIAAVVVLAVRRFTSF